MNYLDNTVCKFTPLFKINYGIKQNILSCCLFKLLRSYKNFNIYVNGLANLNKYVTEYMPDFRIRLFIDNNIYIDTEIMKKISKLDKIDNVLYACPDFLVDDKYHDGLFGTMVRFFPMFNFENNDAGIIGVVDADFNKPESYHNVFKSFQNFKEHTNDIDDVYLYFYGRLFHTALKDKETNYTKPYALAWKIFNVKRINQQILIDYLYEVKYNKNNIMYTDYEPRITLAQPTNFIFGVDEYFINNTLLDYLNKNKLCFGLRYYYQIHFPLFFDYEKYFKENKDENEKNNLTSIINFIVDKIPDIKNKSVEDKYEYIVSKVYFDTEKKISPKLDKMFYYLNYRIYAAYAILRKMKYFDIIKKSFSNLVFKKNFGYILIEKNEYVNCPKNRDDVLYRHIKLPKKFLNIIVKILTDKINIKPYFKDYKSIEKN